MKCLYCGAENPDNTKFCSNCGAPLNSTQQQQQPPQQPNQQYYTPQYQQAPYQPQQPIIINEKKKMGCLTKVLIVLGVFFLLGVIGMIIGGNPDSESTTKYQYESSQSTKETETTVPTKIKETLIYDKHKVKIYVKGIEDNTVKLYIENNSSKNYGINAHSYAVNGIMTKNNIYDMDTDVAANSKANTELEIDKSFLKEYSITDIRTIDVNFWAYDNGVSFKDFNTGRIRIKTNKFSGENARIKSKKNVCKKNDVSIDYISHDGNEYMFSLTNNKDVLITFSIEDITVNGYTDSDWHLDLYGEEVLDGCQYVFIIKVDDDFLEKNGIEKVKTIQFNTVVQDNDDYNNEWATGNISVEVE